MGSKYGHEDLIVLFPLRFEWRGWRPSWGMFGIDKYELGRNPENMLRFFALFIFVGPVIIRCGITPRTATTSRAATNQPGGSRT